MDFQLSILKNPDDERYNAVTYDPNHAGLEELRPRADELIKEAMAELRFHLRHFDRPSQRRIMRTYRVVFRYRKGEAGEDGEEEN